MDGHPRIVPLSRAPAFRIAARGSRPRAAGRCIGADGAVAGRVTDLWIDTRRPADPLHPDRRGMTAGAVLAPMMMAKVDRRRRRVVIDALNAAQFAGAPRHRRDRPDHAVRRRARPGLFRRRLSLRQRRPPGAVAVTEYEHEPIPGLPGPAAAGRAHPVAGLARLAGARAHRIPHAAGRGLFRRALVGRDRRDRLRGVHERRLCRCRH